MAKKDIDLSIDFDKELERELAKLDLGFDKPARKRNKREIVFDSFKDFGKGAISSYKPNAANIERMVKAAIPSTLTSEAYSMFSGYNKLKTTLSKEFQETRKLGKDAVKAVKNLFPKDSKIASLLGKAESKLGGDDSPEAMAAKRESELQLGLQAELDNQFTKEATLQMLTQNMETKRHNSMIQVLQAIHDNTTVMKNFSIEITNSFYRKSLELQYKSLFAMKENVAATKALSLQLREQLENIVKNTAIPDAFKATNKDFLKSSIYSSMANRGKDFLYNNFGGKKLDEMINKFVKRISMSFENVKMGLSSLIQGTDAIGMINEMGDALGGMGPSKSEMGGSMIGTWLGDTYIRQVMEKLARSDKGKKFIFNTKNVLADPVYAANALKNSRIAGGKNNGFLDKLFNKSLGYIAGMGGSGSDYMGKIYKDITDPDAPAMFNNKTQLAIVKIIPDLLSKIYSEVKTTRVGGNAEDHEMTFDYSRQKLVSKKQFAQNVKKDFNRFATAKLKDPMGKLIAGISRHTPLSKQEKADLANYLIEYLISYNPATSLPALKDPNGFLRILPPALAAKVKSGVEKMMIDLEKNTWESSIMVNCLNDIRSAIPHIESRVDSLVGIGEANTARSLGLLRRDRIENNFLIDRDDAKSYIQRNWGNYDESWEDAYSTDLGNRIDSYKTVQGKIRRIKRKGQVYTGRAAQGIAGAMAWGQGMYDNRAEISSNIQSRAKEYYQKALQQFDAAKETITQAQLKKRFQSSKRYIESKAKGVKYTIEQWALETGMLDRVNVVKNKTEALAMQAKSGIQGIYGDVKANGVRATAGAMFNTAKGAATDTFNKVKTKAMQEIPFSAVEEAYYKSTSYLSGALTNIMDWADSTGITRNYKIVYDELKSTGKKVKGKAKETKDRAIYMTKAKVQILEDAIKNDPIDKIKDDNERISVLQDKFFQSDSYISGAVTDFGDWCISIGRDPVTGKSSNMAKAKYDIIKRGGILSKAMMSKYGKALTTLFRFTRKIDRKIAWGLTKGVFKGIRGGAKLLSMPFRPGGLAAMGRGLKYGSAMAADIVTQPFVQMFNAAREGLGLNPVFDGGFLGLASGSSGVGGAASKTTKATRKLERKALVNARRTLVNVKNGIAAAGNAVWGFLFRRQIRLSDEAAKANLSPDTQIMAAGLDRIAQNQEAAAMKEKKENQKNRAGNWLSRLDFFSKKKGKSNKKDEKESKGILQWMKEHKTGLTVAGGFLLVTGLLKGLGITLDDVKTFAKGIWTGIQGVWGFLKSVFGAAKEGLNKVTSFFGFERKKEPIIGPDGKQLTDPTTGEPLFQEGDTEATEKIVNAGKYALGGYAAYRLAGAPPLVGGLVKKAGGAVGGLVKGGIQKLGSAAYGLGTKVVDKATGGAMTKAAEQAAAKAAKKTAKEAAENASKKAAKDIVEKVIENGAKGGLTDKVQAGLLSRVKDKATAIVSKLINVWEAAKKKIKYIWRLLKHPKFIKVIAAATIKKALAKIGFMVAAGATGVGLILTAGFLIWDILWVLKYMIWDDMTFWEAISQQILGVNVFDEKIKKQLEEAGITDDDIHAGIEAAANSETGEAVIKTVTKKNEDGSTTTSKYILKIKGAADKAFAKAMAAKPISQAAKDKYNHIARAIQEGNVSPAEKAAVIDDIIKGKNVTIGGVQFGVNKKEISPGLINDLGADFKNYGPKMKARIMSFAWDAFVQTGYPLRFNGPASGIRTKAQQAALSKNNAGAAGVSDTAPHIMGYGADMSSTHPNIGSNLHMLPNAQKIFEDNGVKLPLLHWKNRLGGGANEPWHVEPAEARPDVNTFGTNLTGKNVSVDFNAMSQFVQGTGKGHIEAPQGELDDLSSSTKGTVDKLNKGVVAAGGDLNAIGNNQADEFKQLRNQVDLAQDNVEASRLVEDYNKKYGTKHTIKSVRAAQQGDETGTFGFNPFASILPKTNSILSEQVELQKQMVLYLHSINKAISKGEVGNGIIPEPKDSHGNPINSASWNPDELPIGLKNMKA